MIPATKATRSDIEAQRISFSSRAPIRLAGLIRQHPTGNARYVRTNVLSQVMKTSQGMHPAPIPNQ